HLAHDCHVGNDVIIANAVQMAGHVTIEDRAIISGLVPIHQFVRIGTFSFVGGGSRVNQDVPPYTKAVGNPVHLYGLNSVGLQRAGLLRRMPGISVAGIYDKNPARAAEVAAQLETVAHEGLAALLERVDAVTVAVPTPAHAEVGIAVLERGIALLMEKPLADSVAGAEALVRSAAARGAVRRGAALERFKRAVRAAAPY